MADLGRWVVEQFAAKLAEVAGSMLGSSVTATLEGPSQELPADALAWEQSFDVADGCRMVVSATESAWEKLGGEALKAAGVDELDRDSVRGTYLEILSQALSGVASELGARLGRNISAVDGREIPVAPGDVSQTVAVVLGDGAITIHAGVANSLIAALDPPPDDGGSLAPAEANALAERHELLDGSKTLDLLLDVELPVSVSFGRASVPLKDVLKLTSGSIVELNRGVTDPVELIVNNCVIARGEVVVVEGNYGVRIQQIVSARERLRTLN